MYIKLALNREKSFSFLYFLFLPLHVFYIIFIKQTLNAEEPLVWIPFQRQIMSPLQTLLFSLSVKQFSKDIKVRSLFDSQYLLN
jgi:hypothetical protein